MFQDVSPEIGYRVVLRLIRGITAKILEDYQIISSDHYARFAEPARSSLRHFLNISIRTHNYLCTLNKKRNPRRQTLYKYILLCLGVQRLLKHLDSEPQIAAALNCLFEAYLVLLNRMLYIMPIGYPNIYLEIVEKLVYASLHHEHFLNPTAPKEAYLTETRRVFAILLR